MELFALVCLDGWRWRDGDLPPVPLCGRACARRCERERGTRSHYAMVSMGRRARATRFLH